MNKKIKVLILHNYMAPYRFPLFKEVAEDLGVDLTVYFMSQSAKNRRWKVSPKKLGFRYEILPKIELSFLGRDLFAYIINYTFPIKFLKGNFDVVISAGWLDFASQIGFFLCKLTGRKFIVWSESTINEPSWRRTVSMPLVKMIIKGSSACIAIGTRSKEYLMALGANPKEVFVAYSTVDIQHFIKKSRMYRKQKKHLRKSYGIKEKNLILYVGQFIERKGLIYLLRAFNKLSSEMDNIALALLGYGPLKSELEEYVGKNKLTNVYLLKHVEVNRMPRVYVMADIFVLPSYEETWGLVINEAMASGLPVITTEKVGSSADLVRNGLSGYVVKEKSTKALYKSIKNILSSADLLETMSAESRQMIKKFSPESAAQNFIKAIKYAARR